MGKTQGKEAKGQRRKGRRGRTLLVVLVIQDRCSPVRLDEKNTCSIRRENDQQNDASSRDLSIDSRRRRERKEKGTHHWEGAKSDCTDSQEEKF